MAIANLLTGSQRQPSIGARSVGHLGGHTEYAHPADTTMAGKLFLKKRQSSTCKKRGFQIINSHAKECIDFVLHQKLVYVLTLYIASSLRESRGGY